MTDLLALAVRCEGAEGPDRELDYLIVRAIHNVPDDMSPLPQWRKPFTASLDAAMGLVPEGWWFHVSDYRQSSGAKGGEVRVYGRDANAHSEAATPALALCAAALRARAAQDVSQ